MDEMSTGGTGNGRRHAHSQKKFSHLFLNSLAVAEQMRRRVTLPRGDNNPTTTYVTITTAR